MQRANDTAMGALARSARPSVSGSGGSFSGSGGTSGSMAPRSDDGVSLSSSAGGGGGAGGSGGSGALGGVGSKRPCNAPAESAPVPKALRKLKNCQDLLRKVSFSAVLGAMPRLIGCYAGALHLLSHDNDIALLMRGGWYWWYY